MSTHAPNLVSHSTDRDAQPDPVSDNDEPADRVLPPPDASTAPLNIFRPDHIAVQDRRVSPAAGAAIAAAAGRTHPFVIHLIQRLVLVTDLEEVLWTVVEAIGKFMGVSCHYTEVDPRTGIATVYRDYCDGVVSLAGAHPLESFGFEMLEPLSRGKFVANEDTAVDPRTASLYEASYAPMQVRSFLSVPLVKQGQWVGHLAVRDFRPRRWLADEILLLEQIVDHTSRFLYDATLQRELRRRVDDSETLIQTLPIGILDAYKQLEAQTDMVKKQQAELHIKQAELEESNRQLAQLAITDGLTGLKNHRTFQGELRIEVARAIRLNSPLAVLLLDIDDFKSYNDTFGHPAGDAALCKVAEILQSTARVTDVVTRYGGEEFGIILVGTGTDSARAAGERFRAAIEASDWQERQVTVSVGVASLFASDVAELIRSADNALYLSKKRGRNCVTHSTDAISASDTIEAGLQEVNYMFAQSRGTGTDPGQSGPEARSRALSDLCRRLTADSPLPTAAIGGTSHLVRYANPAYCRLTGRAGEELIDRPFAEAVPEEDADRCIRLLDRVLETGQAETLQVQQHDPPDSPPVCRSYSAWPVRDEQTHIVGLMCQVTERIEFSATD